MQQANRNKRPHSPTKDRSNSPITKDRDTRSVRDQERSRRDASPVQNKRRRESRESDEKESTTTTRDNRPKYYQPSNPNIPRALMDKENDDKKLSSRQKQVDFGKNTIGYQRYVAAVPKSQRKRTDIWTPDKHYKCSKRSWDGQIRQWRRLLHEYDPPAAEGEIEIDLENEEEDISHLQKELEEDRKVEDKENNKDEHNKKEVKEVKEKEVKEVKEKEVKEVKIVNKEVKLQCKIEEVKVASKTQSKTEKEVKIEIKVQGKTEEFVFTKLPFSEPLEHEDWCDM